MAYVNYKNHPFPVRITIVFFVCCVLSIILMHFFGVWMFEGETFEWTENFFDDVFGLILSILLCILGFGIGVGALAGISTAFCGRKHYRGTGLYIIMIITSVLSYIAFGVLLYFGLANDDYTFFDYMILFSECSAPALIAIIIIADTERCPKCKLINTFKNGSFSEETTSEGKRHKFHTEGGEYKNAYAEYVGSNEKIVVSHYVPKTQIYDGVYERKRHTSKTTCSACGHVKIHTYTTDHKTNDVITD